MPALDPDEVLVAWQAVQLIPVELRSVDMRAALAVAAEQNIYAYDAYFLECALALRCPLLTLDRRLGAVARDINVHVVEVADT